MTPFQRLVAGVTAVVLALRLIFPVTYATRLGQRPDLPNTLLQVIAIVVVATAVLVLLPSISLRATLVVGCVVAFGVAGWLGYPTWKRYQEQNAENSRYQIVEGVRFGALALGMAPNEARRMLDQPFSSASRQPQGLVEYWDEPQGRWIVTFASPTAGATSIEYIEYSNVTHGDLARLQFETAKGARYGQTAETIKALYGDPPKWHADEDPYAGIFGYPIQYYYPTFGIEFGFHCTVSRPKSAKDCQNYSYELSDVTIYGHGIGPSWFKKASPQ